MQETWVRSLGQEDPLEKEMATRSSTLAWKIPWTEEPGRLQSTGWQRVRHGWATSLSLLCTQYSCYYYYWPLVIFCYISSELSTSPQLPDFMFNLSLVDVYVQYTFLYMLGKFKLKDVICWIEPLFTKFLCWNCKS